VVWWSFVAAFAFMVVLVLAANLFATVCSKPSTRARVACGRALVLKKRPAA